VEGAVGQFIGGGGGLAQATAQKIVTATKQSVAAVRSQVEGRARAMLAEAEPRNVAGQVQSAMAPFFERVELPGTTWVTSWDGRGQTANASAASTSGRLGATYALDLSGVWQQPIRADQFSSDAVVHLVRKRTFGKAKPTPIDLSKMLVISIEQRARETVIGIRESVKVMSGFRFVLSDEGASFSNLGATGELEPEVQSLTDEDLPSLRRLADAAVAQLAALRARRTVRELRFGGEPVASLKEPKVFPLELLGQLTPLCRALRERSPVAGELVMKRDIGDGRREELFVPRAQLAARFLPLPAEYRRPFEDMGLGQDEPGELRGSVNGTSTNGASSPRAIGPNAPTIQKIMG
jgi:hypothetical protein